MLRRDERDGLTEIADAVDREHGLVLELEAVELLSGDVFVREHGVHAGSRERGGNVDRVDACVRVRAAQRVAPEHALGLQVARVRELAGHLRDPVRAPNDLADAPELELRRSGGH
jgi:hypothetical protein